MRMRVVLTDITAGTPRNLAVALGFDPKVPCLAWRMLLQMKHGGSSIGSVLENPLRGATLAIATDLVGEMNVATATAPGGSYSDYYNGEEGGGIDISLMAVDVGITNDPVILTADIKI